MWRFSDFDYSEKVLNCNAMRSILVGSENVLIKTL